MQKKIPEIKIVFDTNALFTKVAHDLFQKAIADLIKSESTRKDIKISWCLPKVVVHERQYQMQKAADELLPYLEKLQKLLGHNLNITKEILSKNVINLSLLSTNL